tara:strand:+ start:197 stop:529 length:333 start_codon:yes stop_codon:yes gene_type:complete
MSDYNWCHGPSCHENKTQDRIRGVKGSKVLRTRKVQQSEWNENSFYRYFCSNGCYNDFANKYVQQIVAIAPRLEALETPIEDPKKITHTRESRWGNHSWTTTEIKVVDNA